MSWVITPQWKTAEGVVGVPWDQIPANLKWTPSSITTALWLDAADASTFSYRSGSTVLVSEWRDKSGNGRHCGQSTESLQPTRSTTAVNNKPAVTFMSHILNNDTASLPLVSRSVFLVCYESSSVSNAGFFVIKPAAGNDYERSDAVAYETGNASSNFIIVGGTSTSYLMSNAGAKPAPVGIYGEVKQAGSGSLFVNGSSVVSDNSFTEFSANSSSGYLLGGRFLGGAISTGNRLNGGIAEVVYATSNLNTSDRQKLEGYLAHKWNLTANLPSDHPYKNTVPTP